MVVRAARELSSVKDLWRGSRAAGEVLFFARAKKSTQKKHAPDDATAPSHPRLWDPRFPDAASCRAGKAHASMHAPLRALTQSLRCEGAPYGESNGNSNDIGFRCAQPNLRN